MLFPMRVQTCWQNSSHTILRINATLTLKDVGKTLKHVGQFLPAVQSSKGKAHAMF